MDSSVFYIHLAHIHCCCTCQDPLEAGAAQECGDTGAQTISACGTERCLSLLPAPTQGWELTRWASTSKHLLQVQISRFSPNRHCWLRQCHLWASAEVSSPSVMYQMMLFPGQMLVPEIMIGASFWTSVILWSEQVPKPVMLFFEPWKILQRNWLLGDIIFLPLHPAILQRNRKARLGNFCW